MTGFSTDRLEPTSRGEPVSSQAEQRELSRKPPRRPRSQPRHAESPKRDPDTLQPSDQPAHQIDDLA
jgi:hypothetical protein